MTHKKWLLYLKDFHDSYGFGFTDSHWDWIKNKITYEKMLSDMTIIYFYHIAVRN